MMKPHTIINTVQMSSSGERALADAQRKGFRLAIVGRTIAVGALAFVFLAGYHFPFNVAIWLLTLALALSGLMALKTAGTRLENMVRYVFFLLDAALVSAIIAFAPLSGGDDIPQNLTFFTSRTQFYYVVITASILTLSPGLVLWTGGCCVAGLALSTIWIAAGMESILNFADLPIAPSREDLYRIVLNPDFLGTESRIEEMLILSAVTGIAAIAVRGARLVVLARISAEEKRRHTQRLFGKYLPAAVIPDLKSDGHLSPQMREATLLYADVEGFTSISEKLQPEEIIHLLNELFTMVSEKITMRGGLVVSYFGDAVIAAFNSPLPLEKHEFSAVMAARDILKTLESSEFRSHRLRLRIGIATGLVAVGTVGSEERLSFTHYGDTVNLSQRLEALNRETGTDCLMCGATYTAVQHEIEGIRSLGFHSLRNKQRGVEVYALE
ncbi:adenylate/guanylate cyclase domain-containing protein [Microvirga tunisiensis]|nr:adenylate/guanylate cyclase domain-containing protein [Microvirga tunisiensis]